MIFVTVALFSRTFVFSHDNINFSTWLLFLNLTEQAVDPVHAAVQPGLSLSGGQFVFVLHSQG